MGKMSVWKWLWLNTLPVQFILYLYTIFNNRPYLVVVEVMLGALVNLLLVLSIWLYCKGMK